MPKKNIARLLADPDEHIAKTFGANGVLTSVFWGMIRDLGVNVNRWNTLMTDFVRDPRNGVPDNKKEQTSMRGNLTKEFSRSQMTWKVFLKAMRWLKIVKLEFTIIATHENGKNTVHQARVHFVNAAGKAIDEPDIPESEDEGAEETPETLRGSLPTERKDT